MNIANNSGNTANGRNNGNGTGMYNGRSIQNGGGGCSDSERARRESNNTNSGELLRRIQELGFAKTEAALYLNAHPECALALEYFNSIKKELARLVEEFQNTHGPLNHNGVDDDRWTWVEGIWPWQLENQEER